MDYNNEKEKNNLIGGGENIDSTSFMYGSGLACCLCFSLMLSLIAGGGGGYFFLKKKGTI